MLRESKDVAFTSSHSELQFVFEDISSVFIVLQCWSQWCCTSSQGPANNALCFSEKLMMVQTVWRKWHQCKLECIPTSLSAVLYSIQTHKSQPKSQSSSLHRYDKVRDGSSDPTPPYKMLRRSDESPVSRHGDGAGHGKAKPSHTVRGKNGKPGSGGLTHACSCKFYLKGLL